MIKIVPAMDIINGQCVRLTKGDYNTKKVYSNNPVEIAKQFEDIGVKYLHVVDLDGAKSKHIVNQYTLKKISDSVSMEIDFGGGLKSEKDIELAFDSGASAVTIGSIAVQDKKLSLGWLDKFGSEKIILGADARNGKIAITGWQEETNISVIDFIQNYFEAGIRRVICTDISKDGTLEGPSFSLYKTIKDNFPELELVASGGISKIDDVRKLNKMGIDSVIIGKAIYEKRIELDELKEFLC